MTNYQEASRLYRQLGWGEVAPSKEAPESKKPAEGIYDVFGRGNKATPEQMNSWEESFPNRNCLLKMPVGFIGIDIDHYWKKGKGGRWEKKRGYDYLLEDIVRIGDLPPTYSSTSRGASQDSRILIYKVEPGIEFAPQPYPDVELIQNHHRYACVWPSVHPDTGCEYKWYDLEGRECTPPNPSQITELPHEWYGPLLPHKEGRKATGSNSKGIQGLKLHQPYEGSAEDWVDELDDSDMSVQMHLFFLAIEERPNLHIGHDELLSLLGRLNYLQFKRGELGARRVFDLIVEYYMRYTNDARPLVELSNAIKYVAGKEFLPWKS